MESLPERIQAVMAELDEIQQQLEAQADPGGAAETTAAVVQLKNYLDNLRNFLWAYLEAAAQPSADLDSTLQNLRMKRVADMLRALRAQVDEVDPENAPDAPSFFEELMLAADTVFDKNLSQYKKQKS